MNNVLKSLREIGPVRMMEYQARGDRRDPPPPFSASARAAGATPGGAGRALKLLPLGERPFSLLGLAGGRT